ncbi:OFA family MFS transporter [Sporomusa aerivorans]|uniref:L-lactate MFS transporter n=1 Tax=Sporomusa aerivorans TaxID=204936 RepID=UPI00352A0312
MNFETRRWIYLAVSLVICVCAGIGYSWSVFQNPIVKNFGWPAVDVSLTFTLQIAASTLTPLLIGNIVNKVKTRQVILAGGIIYGLCVLTTGFIQSIFQLYLLYGIGTGIGVGLIYPCLMAYSVKLFPDKKGLSAGLLAASYGSGAIIFAPVAANIIAAYGVLAAFKVLGSIFLIVICVLSRLLGDLPESMSVANSSGLLVDRSTSGIDKTRSEMVKSPVFYVVLALFTLGTTSGLMLMGSASPILQQMLKLTPEKAAFFVGILAVFNTGGRLLWGWLSDRIGRYPVIFSLFTCIGVAMFTLSAVQSFPVFIGAMLLVGLCYGGFTTLIAPVTADMFGTKNLSSNYGLMYIAYGFAGILGPRLAVSLGDYSQAFIAAAVLSLVGILLTAFIAMKQKGVIGTEFNN